MHRNPRLRRLTIGALLSLGVLLGHLWLLSLVEVRHPLRTEEPTPQPATAAASVPVALQRQIEAADGAMPPAPAPAPASSIAGNRHPLAVRVTPQPASSPTASMPEPEAQKGRPGHGPALASRRMESPAPTAPASAARTLASVQRPSATRPVTAAPAASSPLSSNPGQRADGTSDSATRTPSRQRAPEAIDCPEVPQDRLPPSVKVQYSLDRGGLHGEGRLEWRHHLDRYQLKLEGRLPVIGTILMQRSEGRFDDCGLAPRRHSERRLGRSERALSFERAGDLAGSGEPILEDRVRFSSRTQPQILRPGTQDRLSWLVEVAGRLSAWPLPGPVAGDRFHLDVAAVGGDIQRWTFQVLDRDGEGRLHLTRVPDDPFETRAEVWTDPRRNHWPVRVELRESRGDPLVLKLTDWQLAGP